MQTRDCGPGILIDDTQLFWRFFNGKVNFHALKRVEIYQKILNNTFRENKKQKKLCVVRTHVSQNCNRLRHPTRSGHTWKWHI